MPRTTLAERLTRLEQQKNRISQVETKLRLDERKARTRRLIEAGGLVDKAGLLDLEANALYGALLSLRAGVDDAGRLAAWKSEGGRAFDRDAKARDAGKVPLVITLQGAQPITATSRLRGLGFRFSKVFAHWEGLARLNEAESLAAELGGTVRRVGSATDEELQAASPATAAAE